MKLKIKKWDPTTVKESATILLVGRRGTGKSTLLRDLAYRFAQNNLVDYAVGMSPTEESSTSMGSFLPRSAIYNGFEEKVVQNMMDVQRRQLRSSRGYRAALFLDDCAYDKSVMKSKIIREVFMNGRHRRILLLMAMQYVLDMPPDLRSNVDIIIAARDNILSSREKLWKNFFGFFSSLSEFNKCFDACTNNYEVLVLHNQGAGTNNIEDCLFWYKADPNIGQFKLGLDAFWGLDQLYYCDRQAEMDAKKSRDAKLALQKALRDEPIDHVVKGDTTGMTIIGGN